MNLQENHALARYTTYQIGGAADYFVEAGNEEEIVEALEWAAERGKRVFVFGGGSNLLFDDSGFRGLVVRMRSEEVRVEGGGLAAAGAAVVTAGAGVLIAKVVKAAADAGLTGLEAWTGLPGTVGGAVYGNAGCFGTETKDVLKSARVWVPGEGVKDVGVEFFEYDYRRSRLKAGAAGVVLSASFSLRRGEKVAIAEKMREVARSRIQKQPAGSSTGSFFKNPLGDKAGRLIEAAGLKGRSVGRAQVSEQHGNFILNLGGATSADVLKLEDLVVEEVKKQSGVTLEREVVYVRPE